MSSFIMSLFDARMAKACAAIIAFTCVAFAATRVDAADTLAAGAKNYKPYAVEHSASRSPAPRICSRRSRPAM